MRKTTILALFLIIWLTLDVFHIQEALLKFLIIGEIPYTDTIISPSLFLAVLTVIIAVAIASLMANRHPRNEGDAHIESVLRSHEHLPKRRFSRV